MDVVARGIDISSYQGDVNFEKVKAAGYSFVIIKAGQGFRQMGTFRDKYLPAALAAGMDWGAYWWSDAVTVEEAKREAQAFLVALSGLKPTYPVYMDQEYASPCGNQWGRGDYKKRLRTDMIIAFLDVLQNAGYYAALYSSTDWLMNWVYDSDLKSYDKWVAQYAFECTYPRNYGMWQHHGDIRGFEGRVDGINGSVDLNDCYRSYPDIIKNNLLNGWTKADLEKEKPEEKNTVISIEEAARILKWRGYTQILL